MLAVHAAARLPRLAGDTIVPAAFSLLGAVTAVLLCPTSREISSSGTPLPLELPRPRRRQPFCVHR